MRPDPILKWSNPVRKTEDGAVFLWNDRGRPRAVASFYRYKDNRTGLLHDDHEFMSLATKPLTGTVDGRVVWQPSVAGVQPRPIPNAPSPAATEAQRLRQMRALARRFAAFFDNPPDHSEIRLLPQPLYRYELDKSRKDIIDGALFAFVHTTDPEVFLLIEALAPAEGAAPSWHYALARMSMVNMEVKLDGARVWRVAWDTDLLNPTKPYMTRGTTTASP